MPGKRNHRMPIRATGSVGLNKKKRVGKNGIALIVTPTSASGSTGKDWDTQFTKIKQRLVKFQKLLSLKNLVMEHL